MIGTFQQLSPWKLTYPVKVWWLVQVKYPVKMVPFQGTFVNFQGVVIFFQNTLFLVSTFWSHIYKRNKQHKQLSKETSWLFQSIWKICSSNWFVKPQVGMNIRKYFETTTQEKSCCMTSQWSSPSPFQKSHLCIHSTATSKGLRFEEVVGNTNVALHEILVGEWWDPCKTNTVQNIYKYACITKIYIYVCIWLAV